MEKIKQIIEEHMAHGLKFTIAETYYEFGTHYMLLVNGMSSYHSVDLDKVQEYMRCYM